jgi:putative endonuclease
MKTVTRGHQAEDAVAQELKRRGYKVLSQNWKTPRCEIDIVASKDKVIYFAEVKFRSGSAQGVGLEYVGPQKLQRLHFAAQVWTVANDYSGDYRLLVASVSIGGQDYLVDQIIELV